MAAALAARPNARSFVAANENELRESARKALDAYAQTEPVPFHKTTHPEGQWFPAASFGLFMHWGIHSVAGLDPSWAMKKSIPWYTGENPERYQGRERYYALAREFDPRSYEPQRWLSAAKQAGMTYAVLTAKHHDGFCLWPSTYGEWNTRRHMNGRDLLAPGGPQDRLLLLGPGLVLSRFPSEHG